MNRRRIRARRTATPKPQGLWSKLDAARQAAEVIEKNGEHHGEADGNKFKFARVEDVVREAKRALTDHRLLIIPAVVGDKQSWGQVGLVLKAEMEFEIVDVDTGESITVPWIGYGHDKPGDKAINMAISGAKKYFLASLLEIAFVGIDAEADEAPVDLAAAREAKRISDQQDRAAEQPDPASPAEADLPAPDMEGLVDGGR